MYTLKKYNSRKSWNTFFAKSNDIMFPAEYVIRVFKGKYPKLDITKHSFKQKNICDIGCGDGRNIVLLNQCGFKTYGTEISKKIVQKVRSNLLKLKIKSVIRVGNNTYIPYENDFFDFILSWNSCYYMGDNRNFTLHVKEFARVLKKNGYLIMSIPMKTCFIYRDSRKVMANYRIIRNDPYGVRNGEILRIFKSESEIRDEFSKYFKKFIFATIKDDCFGFDYHWHIVICQKR